jgi:putative inorganic carbon (HCO3(-)) transporter
MILVFDEKLEKNLILLIKIGIFLILLTPLVISSFSVYPTVLPKVIYFRILVEILFFLYILLLFYDRKYLPKISPIFASFLIFIVILVLSTLKSINPERSFWGTMERMEGLLTPLHLFVFFVVLVGVFRERKDWLNFLRFAVLLSIPIGITAIIQKMGIFYFYGTTSPTSPRITATLGNAVFYGSYLVLTIFLAIFLAVLEEKKGLRVLFWIITILNAILLLLTGTRGAWIGMAVGFFLLLNWLIFFAKISEEKRKKVLFLTFFFLLFFSLFILFSKLGYLPGTNFFYRFEELFDILANFKESRFFVWKLAIDAWRKNPLRGYGPESFSYIFDTNYKASFIEMIPEGEFYDRSHNQIIDILFSNGIFGLMSYLAIFGSAVFLIFKYRKKFNPTLSFILICLLLSYFIQNIFAFDTISSYLTLFLILGFIDINFKKDQEVINKNQSQEFVVKPLQLLNKKLLYYLRTTIILLTFIFLIFTIYVVNIKPLLVNIKITEARAFMRKGEINKAIESINKSIIPGDFTNFEAYYYSAALLFNNLSYLQREGWGKDISQEFQTLVKPLEDHLEGKAEIKKMNTYLLLAYIYKNIFFIEKDPKFLEDEERVLGKALKLNPQYITTYRLAGEMRFLQKRNEEGKVFLLKAFELDRNYEAFYKWMAQSLFESGEKKEGVESLRKGMKFGDFYTKENFNLETIWQIGDVYVELKDYQGLASFYEETILLYPKELKIDAQIFSSLATTYAKIGEKEKARQTINKMVDLYPELSSSAQEFLSALDKQ